MVIVMVVVHFEYIVHENLYKILDGDAGEYL
jgi:hypothetical protein